MTRVGVTGATGFIGGALVPALASQHHELVLVDDHSGPLRVEHPEWPALVESFSSEEALHALSECDAILHLGAVSGVVACARDPVGTARVNVAGTARLAELCRERRIPLAFASSLAVVGSPERLPVTEDAPPRPTHEYARQKAAGEKIVRDLARAGHDRAAVVRMSNVYGSYSAGSRVVSKGNVLSIFLNQLSTGRLTVNAPGTQRRDFVHIEDVVSHWQAVTDWLSRSSGTEFATFHVASGESYSVLEVAEKVRGTYAEFHPGLPPVRVDVVPNPRAGVELVDPEFAVSRELTEKTLGIRCAWHVDEFLRRSLRAT